jgi:hypothetical protein
MFDTKEGRIVETPTEARQAQAPSRGVEYSRR